MLAKLEGLRTTEGFADMMLRADETAAELRKLRKKADKGDRDAAIELFRRELELARVGHAEAQKRLAALGKLEGERGDKLRSQVANLEASTLMADVTGDVATQIVAGEKLAAMFQAGHKPDDRSLLLSSWFLISVYAEKKGNAKLFADAVKAFRDTPGIRQAFLDQLEQRLEKLKKKGAKGGKGTEKD